MALERIEGVDSTTISYEARSGWVAFDPALTSPDEFIAELERMTGFTAEIVAARRHAADAEQADMDMPGGDDHDHEYTEAEHEAGAGADATSR